MPGRPRRRAMIAGLEERTRVAFPDDPTATHLDYVELWTEDGETLAKLADDLSAPVETPEDPATDDSEPPVISGAMLSRYLDKAFGADETERRLIAARKRGAHRMNDRALLIADGTDAAARDRMQVMVQSIEDADDDDKDRLLRSLTTAAVQRDRLRISARQWTAERWNAENFGQAKGSTFTLNVSALHLAALQSVTPQPATRQLGDGNGGTGENGENA